MGVDMWGGVDMWRVGMGGGHVGGVDMYACGMSVVNGGSVEEDACVCVWVGGWGYTAHTCHLLADNVPVQHNAAERCSNKAMKVGLSTFGFWVDGASSHKCL